MNKAAFLKNVFRFFQENGPDMQPTRAATESITFSEFFQQHNIRYGNLAAGPQHTENFLPDLRLVGKVDYAI